MRFHGKELVIERVVCDQPIPKHGLVRCNGCDDCGSCVDCIRCDDSIECSGCMDSTKLLRCYNCVSCRECEDCRKCRNCQNLGPWTFKCENKECGKLTNSPGAHSRLSQKVQKGNKCSQCGHDGYLRTTIGDRCYRLGERLKRAMDSADTDAAGFPVQNGKMRELAVQQQNGLSTVPEE